MLTNPLIPHDLCVGEFHIYLSSWINALAYSVVSISSVIVINMRRMRTCYHRLMKPLSQRTLPPLLPACDHLVQTPAASEPADTGADGAHCSLLTSQISHKAQTPGLRGNIDICALLIDYTKQCNTMVL